MTKEYRVPQTVTHYESCDTPTDVPGYPSGAQVGKIRECAVLGCQSCQASLAALAKYVESKESKERITSYA